jgi:hypothetical protein
MSVNYQALLEINTIQYVFLPPSMLALKKVLFCFLNTEVHATIQAAFHVEIIKGLWTVNKVIITRILIMRTVVCIIEETLTSCTE